MKRLFSSFKLRGDDGFTALDRLRFRLVSNELWLKFSRPLGAMLGLVAIVLLGAGVVALAAGRGGDDTIPVVLLHASTLPPTPALPSMQPPPAQVLEQGLSLDIWRTSRFAWPAVGRITAFYGRGDATGITIEVSEEGGVRAIAKGVVVSVEAQTPGLYGVVVEHDLGVGSRYANLSDVAVSAGQSLTRGEVIGRAARESRNARGLLHFEMTFEDRRVDPLIYLPVSSPDPADSKPDHADCPTSVIALDPVSTLNLIFRPEPIRSYSLSQVSIAAREGDPLIETRTRPPLTVVLDVPRISPEGGAPDYVLEAIFANGTDRRVVTCRMALQPATAIPARTWEGTPLPAFPSFTPTPATATRTPAPAPTRTATASPTRTRTPAGGTPAATLAPNGGQR